MRRSQRDLLLLLLVGGILIYLHRQGRLDLTGIWNKVTGGGFGPIPVSTGGSGGGGSGTGGGGTGGSPLPSGELDSNGVKLIYQTTGNYVDMEVGSDHENGQRYNVNHKFQNYMIVGYYNATGGTTAIGMKTDGPNHGDCKSVPECFWIDPDFQVDDCSIIYAAEYPHPDSHDVSCSSCTSCGVNFKGKWVGLAGIVYGPPGNRWHEYWVDKGGLDASGKPANDWVQLLKENYSKNIPSEYANRELPVDFDEGLEAEIRMRNGHGTDMKFARVYEIVAPGTATAFVRSFNNRMQKRRMYSYLQDNNNYVPQYLYNSRLSSS